MAFTRANPIGWPTYGTLKSSEQNSLDIDHANAVDRRAGALEVDSQDVTIWVPPQPLVSLNMTFGIGANLVWLQSSVVSAALFMVPIVSRGNGTLKSVTLYMTGAISGTHAAFPATMPIFRISSGGTTAAAAYTDVQTVTALATGNFGNGPTNFSNVVANYNGVWSVVLSNGGAGFGNASHGSNTQLYVRVDGETGANSVANSLAVLGVKTIWTCTGIVAPG